MSMEVAKMENYMLWSIFFFILQNTQSNVAASKVTTVTLTTTYFWDQFNNLNDILGWNLCEMLVVELIMRKTEF